MADPKTFIEANIDGILNAMSLFWEGCDFFEVLREMLRHDSDHLKTVAIVGIAANTRDLHNEDRATADQIFQYLNEG